MASLKSLILITILLFLSIFHSTSAVEAARVPSKSSSTAVTGKVNATLLDITCKKTREMYNDCMQILKSNPKTASPIDSMQFAEAALKFGAEDTKNTTKVLLDLLKTRLAQPGAKEANATCVNWFSMAGRLFGSSCKEIKEDATTANYDTALADSGESADCQNALEAAKADCPKTGELIKRLKLFCRIAYAVTDTLMLEHPPA